MHTYQCRSMVSVNAALNCTAAPLRPVLPDEPRCFTPAGATVIVLAILTWTMTKTDLLSAVSACASATPRFKG